jgi:hypothetical protein
MQSYNNFTDTVFSQFKILHTIDLSECLPNDDIYSRANKVVDVDFEEIPKPKKPSKWNEKTFEEDQSGDDLDVPGSEDDDAQEQIGSEDEENNYYSIGGDNHDDLEENQGKDFYK